eukprot:105837-Heterocapsa_arctica.AAC.1
MDRTEWGGYKHIIMWSEIYQINLYIYCYSMNMPTIDGDEFILDKERILLLYCDQKQLGRHGESLRPDAPYCPSNLENQELHQKE